MSVKKVSVVVSIYNEEESINKFYSVCSEELSKLSQDYELIFVNDGSVDDSLTLLNNIALKDTKVSVIEFSKNFGHEAAMIAGIDYSTGDCIICMDGDLQHPPKCIHDIVAKFEEGYEIVSMIRTEREDGGFFRKFTSNTFYGVLNKLSGAHFIKNSSDFFAINDKVANVLRRDYREKVRYLRGYVQSVGFKATTLEFVAAAREAGESKYTFKKLLNFSMNTILSFSDVPLKAGISFGIVAAIIGIIVMVATFVDRYIYKNTPDGYPTIIVVMCFMFAALFLLIGIIGEYISVLFKEIKDRPIYIVSRITEKGENKDVSL
ncbi:MAG: glycosyltransferase family 2 protein [Lachnospiraceae bacterium]|nr:glycosyltransferase family 2 protein [Lachnospiraceae bacterium]